MAQALQNISTSKGVDSQGSLLSLSFCSIPKFIYSWPSILCHHIVNFVVASYLALRVFPWVFQLLLKKTLIGTGKKTCAENYGVASLLAVNFYLVSDILIGWRLLSNVFLLLTDFIPCSPNLPICCLLILTKQNHFLLVLQTCQIIYLSISFEALVQNLPVKFHSTPQPDWMLVATVLTNVGCNAHNTCKLK